MEREKELSELEKKWNEIWKKDELNHWYVPDEQWKPRRQKGKNSEDKIEAENGMWILRLEQGDKIILTRDMVCAQLQGEWDDAGRRGSDRFYRSFTAKYTGITRDDWRLLHPIMPLSRLRQPTQPVILTKNHLHDQSVRAPRATRWPASMDLKDTYLALKDNAMPQGNVPNCAIFESIVQLLLHSERIVVVVGAGISCAAGIQCFRGQGGLYKSTAVQKIFDADTLRTKAGVKAHYSGIGQLAQKCIDTDPTLFHMMLAFVALSSRLVRLYSMNIDCLETRIDVIRTSVPLPEKEAMFPITVQLHGSLEYARCTICGRQKELNPQVYIGLMWEKIRCQDCLIQREHVNRRSTRTKSQGALSPNIILYNENPQENDRNEVAKKCIITKDSRTPIDTLLVVGTSAKLPCTIRLIRDLADPSFKRQQKQCNVVWVSFENPPSSDGFSKIFTHVWNGECQLIAKSFFQQVGEAWLE